MNFKHKKNRPSYARLCAWLIVLFAVQWSGQNSSYAAPAGSTATPPSDLLPTYGPRPVDGVFVEAVQGYMIPRRSQFGLDFGMWPVQPYYNGFSLDTYYTYHFSKDSAWEVLNFSYLYTVDTDLTTELASSYNVTPKSIERVNYVLSSNYLWNVAYGKFAFFNNNIRYFRSGFMVGPALIVTNTESIAGFCIGWSFETFVNEKTAWRFQIRDNYASGNSHPNNLVFLLGTSYGF
jgi:outer membrane beta-barrel protein